MGSAAQLADRSLNRVCFVGALWNNLYYDIDRRMQGHTRQTEAALERAPKAYGWSLSLDEAAAAASAPIALHCEKDSPPANLSPPLRQHEEPYLNAQMASRSSCYHDRSRAAIG
mmetsp:Transcript_54120/g.116864  ORF Transcript_54120/g.116864 Transcript_54120/m.116864 type:complete len:114 (-) Transcript_54120:706-1047(-)